MGCPFCQVTNENKRVCELDGNEIDQREYDYYCSSSGSGYESCTRFRQAEVLTPAVCDAIIAAFQEAVSLCVSQLYHFVQTLRSAVIRTGYEPLLTAFNRGAYAPSPPSANGRFQSLARTDYEKDLASKLEESLNAILSDLAYGKYFQGAYISGALTIGTEDVRRLSAELDLCGARAAEALENSRFSHADGAGKYVSEAESLARETGTAIRFSLLDNVVSPVSAAVDTLERGINTTCGYSQSLRSSLAVLDDANIDWETDDT